MFYSDDTYNLVKHTLSFLKHMYQKALYSESDIEIADNLS